jgi:hypothetical protein
VVTDDNERSINVHLVHGPIQEESEIVHFPVDCNSNRLKDLAQQRRWRFTPGTFSPKSATNGIPEITRRSHRTLVDSAPYCSCDSRGAGHLAVFPQDVREIRHTRARDQLAGTAPFTGHLHGERPIRRVTESPLGTVELKARETEISENSVDFLRREQTANLREVPVNQANAIAKRVEHLSRFLQRVRIPVDPDQAHRLVRLENRPGVSPTTERRVADERRSFV